MAVRAALGWCCVASSACGGGAGELHFGTMLLQTVLLLALVCGLAVATLRMAARMGVGRLGVGAGRRLELLDELALGQRQSVLVLRAGSKVVLLARSASGLNTLAELDASDWREKTFAEVLESTPPADAALRIAVDEAERERPRVASGWEPAEDQELIA